jgi:hypothetical protein
VSKASLTIMDRGWQHDCYDKVDQKKIGFQFHEFWSSRQIILGQPLSYPVFTPKPCTQRMHDPGSIVPYIRSKVFTNNQMSRIKYDYYYINSVSKDCDNSQRNGIAEDSITTQERQPGQHVA